MLTDETTAALRERVQSAAQLLESLEANRALLDQLSPKIFNASTMPSPSSMNPTPSPVAAA